MIIPDFKKQAENVLARVDNNDGDSLEKRLENLLRRVFYAGVLYAEEKKTS